MEPMRLPHLERFTISFVSLPFDAVLSFFRAHFHEYYAIMYADEMEKYGPYPGKVYWGAEAKMGTVFECSHLQHNADYFLETHIAEIRNTIAYYKNTKLEISEAQRQNQITHAERELHRLNTEPRPTFFGDVRLSTPIGAPNWTVVEFPRRSVDFLMMRPLAYFKRCRAVILQSMEVRDRIDNSIEDRMSAVLTSYSENCVDREVRVEWREVNRASEFRRLFEQKGTALEFENTKAYSNRLITERFNRNEICGIMDRLGISPETLLEKNEVDKVALISCGTKGEILIATKKEREAVNSLFRNNSELPRAF